MEGGVSMNSMEIARDITLKMLELRLLKVNDYTYSEDEEEMSKWNEINAKQITDFFNYINEHICE